MRVFFSLPAAFDNILSSSFGRSRQALKIVIPGIVNTFIAMTKDTSLVMIIGLFDILMITKSSITDAKWLGLEWEGYAFVGLIFWILCFSMSRYSQWLERRLDTDRRG